MNWTSLLILAAILAAFFVFRHSGLISVKDARAYLKSGAMVIDVRTAGEFVAHHLPIAVNLPLSEIEANWSRRVKDKNQVLLLHCQSGARSGVAKKKLSALGCLNAFNMGSYTRAERIVSGK
ncbi:MAG: rhodanese-like domain-containing protein [Terracidiphilus sp.]